jgi:8-oxo-dGTP diphosphatase
MGAVSSPRARVLVTNEQGEVALLRRRVLGLTYWEVPGGHLEQGESSQQAAVREIEEELGLDLQGALPLRDAGRVRVHQLYVARVSGRPALHLQGPEVGRGSWGNAYHPLWVPRRRVGRLLFLAWGIRRAVLRALRTHT